MRQFRPGEEPIPQTFKLITGAITPRPIAFVSSVSPEGVRNLSPFSFFNAFGANPPMVAFSPSRRVRDSTFKDTYYNVSETKECVIQVVTHAMVEQSNLASAEFAADIDEWEKCGLTPIDSVMVKPPRVAESPFQMECKLWKLVPLGDGPGAGNLFLCEVVLFHVAEDILTEKGTIDAEALDVVGRNGGTLYTRASGDALLSFRKPALGDVVGWDNLPEHLRQSRILTANDIARLAVCPAMPESAEVDAFVEAHPPIPAGGAEHERHARRGDLVRMFQTARHLQAEGHPRGRTYLEETVQAAIRRDDLDVAWKVALFLGQLA